MVRRKKWNRRRGDNRLETKADYALIQDAHMDSNLTEPMASNETALAVLEPHLSQHNSPMS